MTTDRLTDALLRGWQRALAVSCSEDLPREYLNVLLPMMPEIAPEFLRAHRDRGPTEVLLFLEHAALLARHAPEAFLERVFAILLPVSPVEIAARGALAVPPEAREPFRARARVALAEERDPVLRVGALLAWSAVEPEPAAAPLLAEALALLPSLPPWAVARVARAFGANLAPQHRERLLAELDRHAAAGDASLLLARCALSPPELQRARALEAVARAERADGEGDAFSTALGAMDLVGFEPLRASFERAIARRASGRELLWTLRVVGRYLSPESLAWIERQARDGAIETWRRTLILAALARHYTERREELLREVRGLVARVVGDPLTGHGMGPEDIPASEPADPLRASVGMAVSAAFDGEERRELQRRTLAIVERLESGHEHTGELSWLHWSDFGAVLDEELRADAARVAVGLRHRPSALKALGELVAAFPPAARHLAVLGLARLADGAQAERLPQTLAALEQAARPSTRRDAPPRRRTSDTAARWSSADEVALARLKLDLARTRFVDPALRASCEALTPAAAARAVDVVLALESPYQRRDVALVLAGVPALRGAAGREALVVELLRPEGRGPTAYQASSFAAHALAVIDERDDAWRERVARFFDGNAWNAEEYLLWVAAFAEVIRRLGGVESVERLAACFREPAPVQSFAQPWTGAALGGDA